MCTAGAYFHATIMCILLVCNLQQNVSTTACGHQDPYLLQWQFMTVKRTYVSSNGLSREKNKNHHASDHVNTFTAIIDLSWFNNSCLKMPASTLVDLIFQSHSSSLNQLTCHCRQETCTATSVYLADIAYIVI
jgi:hypothetical protein